ncbi:cleavage stimulation factor 77 kDa subunit [Thecamonas trahens ATCC 50062]|uniref:Cleavage stimulation factor 77 kDa subunit n=1 Tax=Thecamonas trahens ATCC 50062 TaxID=461836 RepID=A0A0L0D145_THETB|nr:cleavage stimulation factor 77 kDa subunit [Thecamonas trahens ATCC 50062]KNC45972.1 cleavage stimulation factor 77 kDa subunit [Thecamonas trahens ATCC 50062]|eukprot:XP_013762953.1 cleavage stimulation factor 77 kDa subunit [Thecamonas trahens ATCC 50062]
MSSMSAVASAGQETKSMVGGGRGGGGREGGMANGGTSLADALSLIAANQYDTEAWTKLLAAIQHLSVDDAREHYEAFLKVFPTAGLQWMLYAKHEVRGGEPLRAEAIYERALPNVLHMDLWLSYLEYVEASVPAAAAAAVAGGDGEGAANEESSKAAAAAAAATAREKVVEAYEFAVEHMGFHIAASAIWTKYIAFLKATPAMDAGQVARRNEAVRKAYHRAIVSPSLGIEALWQGYSTFENALNVQLAAAILNQHARSYMAARSALAGMRNAMSGIATSGLPLPPSTSPKAINLVAAYRRWVAFECENPLSLDEAMLQRRVAFAYNQALLDLYYYSELWFEAHVYFRNAGDEGLATAFLQRGTLAQPGNQLLAYAYAAHCQSLGTEAAHAAARDCYEALLKATDAPLAYIQYMRFAWRCLSERAARQIFKRARASPSCTYHVYIAAALSEFHFTKDLGIAVRIFEAGMEKYGTEPEYVLAYLDHLTHLNDESAARSVFERSLAAIPSAKAKQVWGAYVQFESMRGDVGAVNALLARRAAAAAAAADTVTDAELDVHEPDSLLEQAARFRFMDLYPLSAAQTSVVAANEAAKAAASKAAASRSRTRSRAGRTANPELALERSKPKPLTGTMAPFSPAGADTSKMPVWLQELTLLLPLPTNFTAPLVNVPFLVKTLTGLDAVPKAGPNAAVIPGRSASGASAGAAAVVAAAKKRKRAAGTVGAPAVESATHSDVFRARQLKKLKK